MKISRSEDLVLGRTTYSADIEDYDGALPVSRLWIDGRLHGVVADRACIAEALMFRSYIGGPVTFSLPCSPRTATAIRQFFAPRNTPILAITSKLSDNPVGGREAHIQMVGGPAAQSHFKILLAPEERFRTILDVDQAVFASNLRTLRRPGESDAAFALALAILFAQDYSIRSINVDRSDLTNFSGAALDALGAAMIGVNLTLKVNKSDGTH